MARLASEQIFEEVSFFHEHIESQSEPKGMAYGSGLWFLVATRA